ncbi:hypothetical protein MNBD_GAMMA22-1371 [hydrothermal vent metagenome]|uniref:Uncharacterized protein n=1 Tax=hydrothermal vent metagenome TaxID=652676 RepID=A0A3B1AG29_9ZZZZ
MLSILKGLTLLLVISSSNVYAFISKHQFEQKQQNLFTAGQVWSYETRYNEKNSRLTILKVDYFEDAVVVHIRLEDIKLLDSTLAHGFRTIVPHMAFLQTALQQSVIKLVGENKRLPEFSKEYQNWRQGDGVGTAWAWHFSVSEALSGLEEIYNSKQSLLIDENLRSNN